VIRTVAGVDIVEMAFYKHRITEASNLADTQIAALAAEGLLFSWALSGYFLNAITVKMQPKRRSNVVDEEPTDV
jgi:hypothetical protein